MPVFISDLILKTVVGKSVLVSVRQFIADPFIVDGTVVVLLLL